MKFSNEWSRRHFLAVSSAATAQAAAALKGLSQNASVTPATPGGEHKLTQDAARIPLPPEVISGGIQPLMRGRTARPLRYRPVAGEFVIRNGREFFNRPLYATSSATFSGDFRVDASDLPEFSLYLPGHGGNLKLGLIAGDSSKWAAQADEVIARYRPGRMIYEIRDTLLGKGMVRAELLTAAEGSGVLLKVEGSNLPAGTRLAWAFGGVSGRKGRRNGDIGCEVEPVNQFFQLRAEECDGNQVSTGPTLITAANKHVRAQVSGKAASITFSLPPNSAESPIVAVAADFKAWNLPPETDLAHAWDPKDIVHPILVGSAEIKPEAIYLGAYRYEAGGPPHDALATEFAARSAQVEAVAQTLTIDTRDEYLNAAGAALGIAADTIWDARQQCVMHGGVAWRSALAGWRGPYVLDVLGHHDRAQQHIRHWLAKQNLSPVSTADPATGPWDQPTPRGNTHLTRKEALLHSNGDLSNNHYDMNMVFMDVMLRHLMWTGDLDFAREVWPALQRHLAWEHRLFRRTYTKDGKSLPLYEAYAAIWASDNLQYNGGGAAHSSAYNLFALRFAARLARAIGEDPTAYETEAALLHEGMQHLLWLPEQGAFAESKDILGPQTVYSNPALWTVYHTIDSEVPTPRQAWQMCAERLHTLRKIPIHDHSQEDPYFCTCDDDVYSLDNGYPYADVPYMLACTDWLPYMWSLNLLLMAENTHMALAMWQAGMDYEACRILKGTVLDSMFMGLCPGDFHMSSALDVHRQEAQRDFGDPIGIMARAIVEGFFGVHPDLIAGHIRIRSGLFDMSRASLRHKDFDLEYHLILVSEVVAGMQCNFTSRFPKAVPVTLILPASQHTTKLLKVTCNGSPIKCAFDPNAVGSPQVIIQLPAERKYIVQAYFSSDADELMDENHIGFDYLPSTYRIGDHIVLPKGVTLAQIDDPQHALTDGHVISTGVHTVFANIHNGECNWTLPLSFNVKPSTPIFAPIPALAAGVHGEPLDLTPVLKNQINEIFTRTYAEPRSQYCSLAFADNLLGGWANPDNRTSIDDAGLRAAGGVLKTPLGVEFRTPSGSAPNCVFLSHWKQDESSTKIVLTGQASGIYLLMAGSTLPQCSRMQHGIVTVNYTDHSTSSLSLRNPETWWPIEQDYLLDDYLFVNDAPLPPRVDLRTGQTRLLDAATFQGKGRTVPGGAATILHLPLDRTKTLASLQVQADLYGIVIALMAATLIRT